MAWGDWPTKITPLIQEVMNQKNIQSKAGLAWINGMVHDSIKERDWEQIQFIQ